MDDILISTNQSDAIADKVLSEIREKAKRSGFPLNPDKTSINPIPKAIAFNIEIGNGNPTIIPERLSEFVIKIQESTNPHQIAGILRYVRQVNLAQYEALIKQVQANG